MMMEIFVRPEKGLRVRLEDGSRHIRPAGELVAFTTYIRRRLAAGDVILADESDAVPGDSHTARLREALAGLEAGNPAHWTKAGKPDLNHLTEVLGRRVTREAVDEALQQQEA